jgi:hypothetical protein
VSAKLSDPGQDAAMFAYISSGGRRMIYAGNLCSADGMKWAHFSEQNVKPLPLTERERAACAEFLASNRAKYRSLA